MEISLERGNFRMSSRYEESMNLVSGKARWLQRVLSQFDYRLFVKANARTNSSKFPVPFQREECYIIHLSSCC